MTESASLRDASLSGASVQEIQLELIRRSSFNEFDGERVLASLMRHRSLWLAVLMDRPGPTDLIKLRDLPDNHWNVDTLFVLTATQKQARELARIIEEEDWAGMVHLYENREEIDRAL